MFDTQNPSAGAEVATADIGSQPIRKVLTNTMNNGILFSKARFEYEDGTHTIIYDKGDTYSGEQVREIPDGFSIVGIYGRCTRDSYLQFVGFIVAKVI